MKKGHKKNQGTPYLFLDIIILQAYFSFMARIARVVAQGVPAT